MSNLSILQLVVKGRTHNPSVLSPCFAIGSNKIHAPTPKKSSFSNKKRSINEKTYNNAVKQASGLMKLFLVPPPITCRATSRLEVYMVGGPEMKGTKDTVSFPHLLYT